MIFGVNPLLLKSQNKDPFFDDVVSLLHFNGADGSTTFTDEIGKTWTRFGNAQIDTAQSQFGGASGLFDGSADYISTPDNIDFEFGSGDFTLETFVRFNGYPANNGGQFQSSIFSKDINGQRGFALNVAGSASSLTSIVFLGFASNPSPTIISQPFSFSLNTWYHVAASRVGNLLYLAVDGVILNPSGTAFNITIQNTTTAVLMGANNFDATFKYWLNGWLDEARITKGTGRYTSDFTVTTSEYPES